ncbi:Uncharacterised protein [Mycobacterium tuberculosis]|uniref:Uncharacterized protein n=1 Tax=Mycobacterium tuberculosis TaxID=1773 RepID=A0A0U0QRD9_MYCTX|nr:Uncharacterised protein [Mycobacterium tuberculosis]COY41827.1 Uncharacterised protein [Mycobacterium tuberculosis]COZ51932.1 Uncharacterised protein [Mycobacterium tuberculosis]
MSPSSRGSNDLDANTIPGTRIAPSCSIRNRYGVSSTIFMNQVSIHTSSVTAHRQPWRPCENRSSLSDTAFGTAPT